MGKISHLIQNVWIFNAPFLEWTSQEFHQNWWSKIEKTIINMHEDPTWGRDALSIDCSLPDVSSRLTTTIYISNLRYETTVDQCIYTTMVENEPADEWGKVPSTKGEVSSAPGILWTREDHLLYVLNVAQISSPVLQIEQKFWSDLHKRTTNYLVKFFYSLGWRLYAVNEQRQYVIYSHWY